MRDPVGSSSLFFRLVQELPDLRGEPSIGKRGFPLVVRIEIRIAVDPALADAAQLDAVGREGVQGMEIAVSHRTEEEQVVLGFGQFRGAFVEVVAAGDEDGARDDRGAAFQNLHDTHHGDGIQSGSGLGDG